MSAMAYGLLPGQSIEQAADVIAGESEGARALPILPQRGVDSDALATTLAFIKELPVDLGPRGWVVQQRPQLATMRLRRRLRDDLDAIEAQWGEYSQLKLQICGPWTLLSAVELNNGHRILADPGASRDIAAMLVDATAQHIHALKQRFGAHEVVVHILEPAVHRLADGTIPGTSDFDVIAARSPKLLGEREHDFISQLRAHTEAKILLDVGSRPLMQMLNLAAPDALVFSPIAAWHWEHEQLDGLADWLGHGAIACTGSEDPRDRATAVLNLVRELGYSAETAAAAIMLDDPTASSDLLGASKVIAEAREASRMLQG
ncbi:hypothetical protein [Corynebacterium pseudopelargi]|uniref:Cobalamin-independent synthase, Catalytic domain n=1 Tax=Corynebacterium pseudopelargi TaxID=2080757 RepID=A0A3G6IUM3_9CORY|nr:hypothetical protein [Corynebacterium pseudopelargi]AZA09449.1 hypothetical protein CPPEL_06690 [Corynebacterium pseudopelargi]